MANGCTAKCTAKEPEDLRNHCGMIVARKQEKLHENTRKRRSSSHQDDLTMAEREGNPSQTRSLSSRIDHIEAHNLVAGLQISGGTQNFNFQGGTAVRAELSTPDAN